MRIYSVNLPQHCSHLTAPIPSLRVLILILNSDTSSTMIWAEYSGFYSADAVPRTDKKFRFVRRFFAVSTCARLAKRNVRALIGPRVLGTKPASPGAVTSTELRMDGAKAERYAARADLIRSPPGVTTGPGRSVVPCICIYQVSSHAQGQHCSSAVLSDHLPD